MLKKVLKRILGMFQKCRFGIKNCGKNLYIGKNVKIVGGKNIVLGDNVDILPYGTIFVNENASLNIGNDVRIARGVCLRCANHIEIENGVLLGPNVFIGDHDHAYEDISKPIRFQGISLKCKNASVFIGEGSFVGYNTMVMGNVLIGKHCVIGANSVVAKNIPDYTVAAGNPIKLLKRYDFEKKEWVRI